MKKQLMSVATLLATTMVNSYRSSAPSGFDPLNMATAKQTKNPATAPADGTADPAKPVVERDANDRFTIVLGDDKKPKDAGKQPPQAQVIINTIAAAGKNGLTRKELCDALGDGVTGPLKTKQGAGRILSYYQKRILASGAVTMVAQPAPAAAAPAAKAA